MRVGTVFVYVFLAVAVSAAVGAVIPHADPAEAMRQMHLNHNRRPPPPAATGPAAESDQNNRNRYRFDGPWEMIADVEFGLKATPTANDNGLDVETPKRHFDLPVQPPIVHAQPTAGGHIPLRSVTPPPPPPIVHSPSTPGSVHPLPPTPTPAQIAAEHQRRDHPTLPKPVLIPSEVAAQIKEATRSVGKPLDLNDAAHRGMSAKQIMAEVIRYAALIKQQKTAEDAMKQSGTETHPHTASADSLSRARMRMLDSNTLRHRFAGPPPPPPTADQPIEFVLKFSGRCEAKSEDGKSEIPWCKLKAQSQQITTLIHPKQGVESSIRKLIGSVAHMHLFDVQMISETAFTTRGNLTFGSTRHKPHALKYESAGEARVTKLKSGERQFTAQFAVSGGEGTFADSKGTVTMNGRLLSPLRMEALVTGVIYKETALVSRHVRYRRDLPHRHHNSHPRRRHDTTE